MWFKKKSQISGYNSNTAYNGTDLRIPGGGGSWTPSSTLPSAADANNYFYLPALGNYGYGSLGFVGTNGFYWSSSGSPYRRDFSCYLSFNSGEVNVSNTTRDSGLRVEPAFK